jgi:hypothetical protein
MEATMTIRTELDHIVVACNTLDEGRAWCRDVLGVDAIGGASTRTSEHTTLCSASPRRTIWKSSPSILKARRLRFRAGSGSIPTKCKRSFETNLD